MYTGGRFLLLNGATIPADSQGIPWFGISPHDDGRPVLPSPTAFTIEHVKPDGRTSIGVELEFMTGPLVGDHAFYKPLLLVKPRGGFAAGSQYVFTDHAATNPRLNRTQEPSRILVNVGTRRLAEDIADSSVALTPALPTQSEIRVVNSASCSMSVNAAQIPIELQLGGSLGNWRDILLFSTTVDGELWHPRRSVCSRVAPGESWTGRATDLLFAACGTNETRPPRIRLEEGEHDVTITAWWPGSGSISAGARVMLRCSQGVGADNGDS